MTSLRLTLAALLLAAYAPSGALAVGGIGGTVTKKTGGTPVANYQVEVYAVGAANPITTACTDALGKWAAPVEAGTYEVYFSGKATTCGVASTDAPQWYNNRGRRKFADPVSIADGASVTTVDAALVDGARVAGTVTSADTAAPLGAVTIDLLDADGTLMGTACSAAADGRYAIDPLPGGVYTARFSANGHCGSAGQYQTQYYDGSSTQAGATAIGLTEGQEANNVNAAMVAGSPGPQTYTLTVQKAGTGAGVVTSQPAGIDCGLTCSAAFQSLTAVTLTAAPASGSTFAGFDGGGCGGTGPCTVTMATDLTVTATFNTATASGGGGTGGGGGTTTPSGAPTGSSTPSTVSIPAPQTRIKRSRIDRLHGKATFTFVGSGGAGRLRFQCALTRAHTRLKYRACSSPARYKRLKKGRYVFRVRAVDAFGRRDASPARKSLTSRL